MVCQGLDILGNAPTIASFLAFPTNCHKYFYAEFLFAVFIILSYSLFTKDEQKIGKGDFISSTGVTGIVVIVLATLLTFFGNSVLPNDVYLEILVACLIFIFPWFLKR